MSRLLAGSLVLLLAGCGTLYDPALGRALAPLAQAGRLERVPA